MNRRTFLSNNLCLRYAATLLMSACGACAGSAAQIGVDAVHGFNNDAILASGSSFSTFRSVITGLGHTIVPLNSFEAGDLAGLDGVILNIPYSVNGANYSASEMTAIQSFASQRAMFFSDSSGWSESGDRRITFGDNQLLLENALAFVSAGNGAIFIGDNGTGFQPENFNSLVSPYGVSYALAPTDSTGRTVSGFVAHPVTSGLSQIGVDYQLPLTISGPAVDLTTGGGQDNVLAAYHLVPEPSSLAIAGIAGLIACRPSRRGPKRS